MDVVTKGCHDAIGDRSSIDVVVQHGTRQLFTIVSVAISNVCKPPFLLVI